MQLPYINKTLFLLLSILSCIYIYPAYSVEKASSEKADVLRVGVIPFDPFVIAAKDENKGISIELWEEIARLNNWKYEYDFLPESGYKEIEPLLKDNKLDVVIGPIAISYRRLEDISYSIPYFITTSNVITKDTNTSFGSLLLHFVKRVFRLPLFLLLLTVLVCSFLVWLKERKNFPDRFPQSFKHGIPYSIWYGFHAIFSADIFFEIKDTYARVLTVIMLICSVALVSISAAAITSALTLSHSQFANKTALLEDLQGESVAIISGTEVDRYARNLEANIVTVDTMEQAFEALRNDEVSAVIADKLLARDYLYKHKPEGVQITEIVVRSNVLSIALQKDSDLKDKINYSIVRLQNEDWLYRMCLHYLNRHEAAFCTL